MKGSGPPGWGFCAVLTPLPNKKNTVTIQPFKF